MQAIAKAVNNAAGGDMEENRLAWWMVGCAYKSVKNEKNDTFGNDPGKYYNGLKADGSPSEGDLDNRLKADGSPAEGDLDAMDVQENAQGHNTGDYIVRI